MAIPGKMTKFVISELSGVTKPAQGGAKAVIMKREFTAEERQAAADAGEAMPDGGFPIKTTADLGNAIKAFGRAKNPDATKRHIIARAKALGASDQLPESWSVSKGESPRSATEGDPMSAEIKKALGLPETASEAEVLAAITKANETAGSVAALTVERDRAVRKAAMDPEESDYCKAMSDDEKDAFMSKPAADRKAAMKKALDSDEVLTTAAGTIRKSAVGEGVFAILKSQEERLATQASAFEKSEAERKTAVFAKRAIEEFPHLAGTVADRALVLKHLDGADAATKTAAEAIFKAAEGASKLAFDKLGHGDGQEGDGAGGAASAEAKLRKMAEDKASASGGKLSFAKAYDEVIQAHPDLYEEALDT